MDLRCYDDDSDSDSDSDSVCVCVWWGGERLEIIVKNVFLEKTTFN